MHLHDTIPLIRKDKAVCPRCHFPLQTVNVHGHEQCVHCKSNIVECCSGEICEIHMISRQGQKEPKQKS